MPTSITNGWDAICAFDVAQLNQVFLQQFLFQQQTSFALNVQTALMDPSGNGLLLMVDVLLGPPEVSFPDDLSTQQLNVTMAILGGQLIQLMPQGITAAVISVLNVTTPAQSQITGPVSLAQVPGSDIVGSVVLNLASGAYDVTLEGIAPGSPVSAAIGAALQSYFATSPVNYVVATVAQSNVPAPLQPTAFDLYLQPSPDVVGDGALLLFIKTTGTGGPVAAMSPYPISGDSGSTLIISGNALFNGVLLEGLNDEVKPFGTSMISFPLMGIFANAVFMTQPNSQFGLQLENDFGYSCGWGGDKEPVAVPFELIISYSNGQFTLTWSAVMSTYWYSTQDGSVAGPLILTLNWNATMSPSIDSTGTVSFTSPGLPQVTITDGSVSLMVENELQTQLNAAFENFVLPPIDTFVLSNLLFANPNAFTPESVSLDFDMTVTGTISPGLVFEPGYALLAATEGATASWSVSYNGQPVGADQLKFYVNGPGSIDANGIYTPSLDAPMPAFVVITGILIASQGVIGSALLIVYEPVPAGALTIDPSSISLSAGYAYTFTASTGVNVTLSPNIGTLSAGDDPASFVYTAPDTVDMPQPVTITATSTSDASQNATVTVNLLTNDDSAAVNWTTTPQSLSPGEQASLVATADLVGNWIWASYPPGFGSITPTGDGSTATYTAPPEAAPTTQVSIVAYGNMNGVAGSGTLNILVG